MLVHKILYHLSCSCCDCHYRSRSPSGTFVGSMQHVGHLLPGAETLFGWEARHNRTGQPWSFVQPSGRFEIGGRLRYLFCHRAMLTQCSWSIRRPSKNVYNSSRVLITNDSTRDTGCSHATTACWCYDDTPAASQPRLCLDTTVLVSASRWTQRSHLHCIPVLFHIFAVTASDVSLGGDNPIPSFSLSPRQETTPAVSITSTFISMKRFFLVTKSSHVPRNGP